MAKKTPINLNNLSIVEDANSGDVKRRLKDYSMTAGNVSVHFRDLSSFLVKYIEAADAVVGCVAWLTHKDILSALSKKRCSIIVQKEDFLRPDTGETPTPFKTVLRERYAQLQPTLCRQELFGVAPMLNMLSLPEIEPIRCVGLLNTEKLSAFPRCHHKFAVFCHTEAPAPEDTFLRRLKPYAVWTGSFNFTDNGSNSLENGIYIEDARIARAFAEEHSQILALSESLDWMQDYHAPEYRIGT